MPSALSKSNVLGWLMNTFIVLGPFSGGPFSFKECSFTFWLKAMQIISCSSQSDSKKPLLLVRQCSSGWSSDSFRHSQPDLLIIEDRSKWPLTTGSSSSSSPEPYHF